MAQEQIYAEVKLYKNQYGHVMFSYYTPENVIHGLFAANPELISQMEALINNGRAQYPHSRNQDIKINVPV